MMSFLGLSSKWLGVEIENGHGNIPRQNYPQIVEGSKSGWIEVYYSIKFTF